MEIYAYMGHHMILAPPDNSQYIVYGINNNPVVKRGRTIRFQIQFMKYKYKKIQLKLS